MEEGPGDAAWLPLLSGLEGGLDGGGWTGETGGDTMGRGGGGLGSWFLGHI